MKTKKVKEDFFKTINPWLKKTKEKFKLNRQIQSHGVRKIKLNEKQESRKGFFLNWLRKFFLTIHFIKEI